MYIKQINSELCKVDYCMAGYSSSMAIAEAKQRKVDAEKKYKKLKKNPRPKLYDRPPHLMKHSE